MTSIDCFFNIARKLSTLLATEQMFMLPNTSFVPGGARWRSTWTLVSDGGRGGSGRRAGRLPVMTDAPLPTGLRTGTARHGRHGSSGDGDRADERDQLLHGQVQLMASAAVTKVGHASKQTRLLVDLLYTSRLRRCTLNRWACPWRNALLTHQQKLHYTERKRTTVHTVRCSTSRRIQ